MKGLGNKISQNLANLHLRLGLQCMNARYLYKVAIYRKKFFVKDFLENNTIIQCSLQYQCNNVELFTGMYDNTLCMIITWYSLIIGLLLRRNITHILYALSS